MHGPDPRLPDSRLLAHFVDRTRRRLSACRAGPAVAAPESEVGLRDLGPGFATWKVIDDGAATPTASSDRVFWLTPDRPITAADVREAIAFYRGVRGGLGHARAFFIVHPEAWTDALGEEMLRAGLKPWPYVRYPLLMRPTADQPGEVWRESALTIRIVRHPTQTSTQADGQPAASLDRILDSIGPWYGSQWLPLVRRVVMEGSAELHVAFDGEGENARPVAIGGLVVDGDFGYVCFGSTQESSRCKGAQTSLFRSRLASARQQGAKWCLGETNTVAEASLRNFLRCGFTEVLDWRVWGWEEAAAARSSAP